MSTKSDDEFNRLRDKYLTSPTRSGFGIFNGYTLPIAYENYSSLIEDFEVFDDDIWLCSFPKSGTTWTQEMVWCICNNLDFEAAKEDLEKRFVFLEESCIFQTDKNSVDVVRNMKRPRFIKSHLPWDLLPKQIRSFEKRPKIIHVSRNPMDTFVSYYYFAKYLGSYHGDIDLLLELFLNHRVNYSPYDNHIFSYWSRRNEPNVLCIKYEDMKLDLSKEIDRTSKFFQITVTKEGKLQLISYLSFDSMKKRQNSAPIGLINTMQKINVIYDRDGSFMRSGKLGGYRTEMSEEAIQRFKRQFVYPMEKAGLTYTTQK